MLLKLGVDISRLKHEIRKKLIDIGQIFYFNTGEEPVITSTYEGSHSDSSLHYAHLAIDFRLPKKFSPKSDIDILLYQLKQKLGPDYDIVKEQSHIHIEYDPK